MSTNIARYSYNGASIDLLNESQPHKFDNPNISTPTPIRYPDSFSNGAISYQTHVANSQLLTSANPNTLIPTLTRHPNIFSNGSTSQIYFSVDKLQPKRFSSINTPASHSDSLSNGVISHQTHILLDESQLVNLTSANVFVSTAMSYSDLPDSSVLKYQDQLIIQMESLPPTNRREPKKKQRLSPCTACIGCKKAKRRCDVKRPCKRCNRNELSCETSTE